MPTLHGPKCTLCRKPVAAVVLGRRTRVAPEQGGCDCPKPKDRPPGWKPNVFTGTHPHDGIHYHPVKMPTMAENLKRRRPKG
jgi:hypothetical protein